MKDSLFKKWITRLVGGKEICISLKSYNNYSSSLAEWLGWWYSDLCSEWEQISIWIPVTSQRSEFWMWLLIVRNYLLTGNCIPSIKRPSQCMAWQKKCFSQMLLFIVVHYQNFIFWLFWFSFSAACALNLGLLDIPCFFMVFSSWKLGLDFGA